MANIMKFGGGPVSSGSTTTVPVIGTDFNWTGGDNTYLVLNDDGGNWRIKFLSSGVFTPLRDMLIDAFLVGAGGGGSLAGAGGGYTTTSKLITLFANTEYTITIGAGGAKASSLGAGSPGGSTSAFEVTASGGKGGGSFETGPSGGNGGSGGGNNGGTGGTDGSDGVRNSSSSGSAGKGQGTTTREFGEPTGDLYASGGSGISDVAEASADNTGDGGDYMNAGGSGIVIIRNHKET